MNLQFIGDNKSRRQYARLNDLERLKNCRIGNLKWAGDEFYQGNSLNQNLQLVDISEGGAKLELHSYLMNRTVGTEFSGLLNLDNKIMMQISFRIIRSEGRTIAVEFTNRTPELKRLIRGYFHIG